MIRPRTCQSTQTFRVSERQFALENTGLSLKNWDLLQRWNFQCHQTLRLPQKLPLLYPSLLFSLAAHLFFLFRYFSDLWLYTFIISYLFSFAFPFIIIFLMFLQSLFFTMFGSLPFISLFLTSFCFFFFLMFLFLFFFFLSFIFFNFPECSSSFDSFAVLFFSLFFLFSLTFRSFYCLILCKLEVPQQTLRTVLWSWKHGYLGPEALTERRLRDQGPWTVIIMGLGAYKLSRKLPLLCRNLLRPIVPNY